MADVFALLRTGTTFASKRPQGASARPGESAGTIGPSELPSEIDFFDDVPGKHPDHNRPPENVNPKKRKHEAAKSTEDTDATALRKRVRISVTGETPPAPIPSFLSLAAKFDAPKFLLTNIEIFNFDTPTPIQMQSIPIILEKRDLLACAPTGSGKTLAYLIPLVIHLKRHYSRGFRAVIITPTRELAQQIDNEIKKLTKGWNFKICMLTKRGIERFKEDSKRRKKYDLLISTPMRLVHGINSKCLELDKFPTPPLSAKLTSSVEYLVLDEADKLFELGLLEQTDEILAACTSKQLHKGMFSATIPAAVEQLARSVMTNPLRVIIGQKDSATESVTQELIYAGTEEGKLFALRQLITSGTFSPPCLIFVQSIVRAKALHAELLNLPLKIDVLHSDMPKRQRDAVVQKFRDGETWILIATDVLSRGIDVLGIKLVVNYDFPTGTMSYIHRIGRTGRAGRRGRAITYFTNDDREHLSIVVNVMKQSGWEVPEWMNDLPKLTKRDKRRMRQRMVKRKDVDAASRPEKKGKPKKS